MNQLDTFCVLTSVTGTFLSSVCIYALPQKFRKSEHSERRNYWMENWKYYVWVSNV